MKEGRKPVPGPPGGDKDLFIPSSTSSGEYDLEPSRTDPTFKLEPEPDPSPRSYDEVKPHHTPDIPLSRSNSSPSSSPYPSNYPTHDFHPPPSTNNTSENSNYPQPYHHQSIHKTLNSIFHQTTRLKIFRLLTNIPISNLTPVLQRVASQLPHLIILLTTRALTLLTLLLPLQPLQLMCHLLNTPIQAAEMELFQNLFQLLRLVTNMTAIISHHLRKLLRHTRPRGLQSGLWHLMMSLLQWTT